MAFNLIACSKIIAKVLFVVATLSYPFLVYFSLGVWDIRVVAVVLLAIMVARSVLTPNVKAVQKWGVLGAAAVIAVLVLVFNNPLYLKLYPVMVSALMFCIFAMSVVTPPSIIETFARLHFKGETLPVHVVEYTRNVTKIWCGFFVLNGLVAAYTVTQPMTVWTFYNGLISYILMGCLFIGEFLFRHFVIKKRGENG